MRSRIREYTDFAVEMSKWMLIYVLILIVNKRDGIKY